MTLYPNEPRRRAEFIFPPNTLKAKVGSGGLDERIILKAQRVIDESGVDFLPIGKRYLASLQEGMRTAASSRGKVDDEALIATMIYPAMQLKANGGMFGYPDVTAVAARLIRFLEYLREPNTDAIDLVKVFTDSLQAILIMGDKGRSISSHSDDLNMALDDACKRYFEKYGY